MAQGVSIVFYDHSGTNRTEKIFNLSASLDDGIATGGKTTSFVMSRERLSPYTARSMDNQPNSPTGIKQRAKPPSVSRESNGSSDFGDYVGNTTSLVIKRELGESRFRSLPHLEGKCL